MIFNLSSDKSVFTFTTILVFLFKTEQISKFLKTVVSEWELRKIAHNEQSPWYL